MVFSHSRKELTWLVIVLSVILGVMVGIGADRVPSPWFDEGWTLVVARNWLEHGEYARKLIDEWISAEPWVHPFSVTVPVAASFRIFGVGVLQGRLPSILFTIGILALMIGLSRQMYGNKTAWVTLAVLVFMAPQLNLNPVLFGRQVLGETAMLFYLLFGYWFWIQALRGSRKSLILVSLFWGLALITKRQILPFWLAATGILLLVAVLRRERQVMRTLILVGLGTGVATAIYIFLGSWLVGDRPSHGTFPLEGVYNIAAWNLVPEVRLGSLKGIFRLGLFSLFGLVVCARNLFQRFKQSEVLPAEAWCELSLIILTGSWSIWYAFGSLGWPRYYYPVFILSTGFYAHLLTDWTVGFRRWPTPKLLQEDRSGFWKALIALALIIINLGFVIRTVGYPTEEARLGMYRVSEYFNNKVASDALVETYESELHFLLRQPVHYPPDWLYIDLNKRTYLGQSVTISYNPLSANPDYLVIGPIGESWQLYAPLEQSGDFLLIQEFPGYKIYERKNR